jgi:hypothetical protein
MTRSAATIIRLAAGMSTLFGCDRAERPVTDTAATRPDSTALATAALDTLRRLGAKDYVVDSIARSGDTSIVWCGPRVWMATDRPTSAVSVVAPMRVVGVRHVMGG